MIATWFFLTCKLAAPDATIIRMMTAQAANFEALSPNELRGMSQREFDTLPFGAIQLDRYGTIRAYNLWESQLARRKPEAVIGKNFFRDVAPCTDIAGFRGKLDGLIDEGQSSYVFDFEFDFPWGRRSVRIRFLVESQDERWVFVTDVT